MPQFLRVYRILIEQFLAKQLTGEDFSLAFMCLFLNEKSGMRQDYFSILQNLFEDCDAYDSDWTETDQEKYLYRITEPTLRQEAQRAHTELRELD